MVSARYFAQVAERPEYDKLKYDKCDCQHFVETVLFDSGCKKPDGGRYNWAGSNSMWRNALSKRGSIAEFIDEFGDIPAGSWVFMLRFDGGEVDRGYRDGEGNATHVGIYIGGGLVRDSTRSTKTGRDGVGTRSINDFNMVGLCKYLDYDNITVNNNKQIKSILSDIKEQIRRIEGLLT